MKKAIIKSILSVFAVFVIMCNLLPDTLSINFNGYRNLFQLVAWCNGYVLDDEGNGRVTSIGVDDYYNYIYYPTETFSQGDKVFTLCIYNPTNLYGDDVIRILDIKTGER